MRTEQIIVIAVPRLNATPEVYACDSGLTLSTVKKYIKNGTFPIVPRESDRQPLLIDYVEMAKRQNAGQLVLTPTTGY
ncbi:hypothetical protein [Photobacterium damselae]|uniref:hypothetical protein n=1 Tax=Photobacterium damselae TaxID=38293 RepID=UPI000D0503A6|nr:hypothetical protein [Photobacterium damselae]PSB78438.1 hypothetical protein C5F62_17230 [Photobacterium damselae subsp. damselae]